MSNITTGINSQSFRRIETSADANEATRVDAQGATVRSYADLNDAELAQSHLAQPKHGKPAPKVTPKASPAAAARRK